MVVVLSVRSQSHIENHQLPVALSELAKGSLHDDQITLMLLLGILGVAAALLSLLSAMDGNVVESAALAIGCVGGLGMLKFVELRY